MKAYVRCGDGEHALITPLAGAFGPICDHLPSRVRVLFDRIAKLDRERQRGEHVFERVDLLELVVAAYDLLCDPPTQIRKLRRIGIGPLPAAERIGELRDWLAARPEAEVIYDLWRSTTPVIEEDDEEES